MLLKCLLVLSDSVVFKVGLQQSMDYTGYYYKINANGDHEDDALGKLNLFTKYRNILIL